VNTQESLPSPDLYAAYPPQSGCWTPQRQQLKQTLARFAPSLAELYEGAVFLLFQHRLAGYTRLVGHAVREIRNRLPSAISGSMSAEQVQYKNRFDSIIEICRQIGFPTDGTLPVAAPVSDSVQPQAVNCSLPLELARPIFELVRDHESARERPKDAARRLFIGLRPENERFTDALRPAITQWLEITGWFMSITHDNGRVDLDFNENDLVQKFEIFESTLRAIVQQFFTTTDALDEILEEANS
jgi:hypothetical protein